MESNKQTDKIKPLFVFVDWSESERFEDRKLYDFRDFELKAASVAAAHKTGGYLKTSVTVLFDDGSTYQCRLDLAPHDVSGFEDHIRKTLHFANTAKGRESLYGPLADCYPQMLAFWRRMDFTRPLDDGAHGQDAAILPRFMDCEGVEFGVRFRDLRGFERTDNQDKVLMFVRGPEGREVSLGTHVNLAKAVALGIKAHKGEASEGFNEAAEKAVMDCQL